MKQTFIVLYLFTLTTSLLAAELDDKAWSATVNGVEAQIMMKETKVIDETSIISTYLTLRRVSGSGILMMVPWASSKLKVRVVDEKGNELRKADGPYSGGRAWDCELVLPYDSSLTFNVSQSGLGISKGKQTLLDFGPMNCWVIDKVDAKKYFLQATLIIEDSGKPMNEGYWHGTISIPKVEIPLKK